MFPIWKTSDAIPIRAMSSLFHACDGSPTTIYNNNINKWWLVVRNQYPWFWGHSSTVAFSRFCSVLLRLWMCLRSCLRAAHRYMARAEQSWNQMFASNVVWTFAPTRQSLVSYHQYCPSHRLGRNMLAQNQMNAIHRAETLPIEHALGWFSGVRYSGW